MHNGALLYRSLKVLLRRRLTRLYNIRTEGLENLPAEGPVILAANHVSFMDSIYIPLAVPRPVVYLTKAEYFDSWKTAWFFRSLGMIPLDRQSKRDAESALAAALALLEQGGVLGMYPEGTRSPDGRLYRGRTGVARLVLRSGAPVLPIGISGSRDIMPKGARFPKLSGNVVLRFGKPLTFSSLQGAEENESNLRIITDEVMFQIMNLSGQTYVDTYAETRKTQVAPEDLRPPSNEKLG